MSPLILQQLIITKGEESLFCYPNVCSNLPLVKDDYHYTNHYYFLKLFFSIFSWIFSFMICDVVCSPFCHTMRELWKLMFTFTWCLILMIFSGVVNHVKRTYGTSHIMYQTKSMRQGEEEKWIWWSSTDRIKVQRDKRRRRRDPEKKKE